MSGFFDSEQVRESLFELDELQHKLFSELFEIPFSDSDKKKGPSRNNEEFFRKTKSLYF